MKRSSYTPDSAQTGSRYFRATALQTRVIACIKTVVAALLLWACTEDSNPDLEKEKFTSVFDDNQYTATFYPIDLRQTADGGYLILSERKIPGSNYRGSYLLRADAFGNFVKHASLDQYSNPVGALMEIEGEYLFFTLDTLNLQSQLIKVDADLENVEMVSVPGPGIPSAAGADGNGCLLLRYDHVDKTSVFSRHDADGNVVQGPVAFSIGAGDDVEEPIMNHILRTGRRFPFQVGKVSNGLYFFNGFQNYSFSLVFTDLDAASPSGVVHGQQDDGGFSAVVPLANGKFAASRFDFGQNYFLPGVTLKTSGPSISANLGGFALPELVPDAPVKILRATVGTRDVLIFVSDTRSKQIGLFFYDEATGNFIGSRYLGFSNPFEMASIIRTQDEGIAVCGTTWLAGRFPRICLFKLSAKELNKLVE